MLLRVLLSVCWGRVAVLVVTCVYGLLGSAWLLGSSWCFVLLGLCLCVLFCFGLCWIVCLLVWVRVYLSVRVGIVYLLLDAYSFSLCLRLCYLFNFHYVVGFDGGCLPCCSLRCLLFWDGWLRLYLGDCCLFD